ALKQEIESATGGQNQPIVKANVQSTDVWSMVATDGVSNTMAFVQKATLTQASSALQPVILPAVTLGGVILSPPAIDFGYQLVGTTGPPMVETVTNSTLAPIVIKSINVTGRNKGDFAATYDFTLPVTIAPGDSITINLSFTPAAPWRAGT